MLLLICFLKTHWKTIRFYSQTLWKSNMPNLSIDKYDGLKQYIFPTFSILKYLCISKHFPRDSLKWERKGIDWEQ